MTLDRTLFSVTERFRYFNHAAVGVLPKPTKDALHAFIDAHAGAGVMGVFPYERRMDEYRAAIAAFIGAQPGTIATLRNTGDGANVLARGIRWNTGDEIVLPDNEFPANVYPWLALRDLGVRIRFVETARARLTPDVLRAHMSSRTRAVAVSWVSFADGYRHDLDGLAQVAHERGAWLFVDAIQGLGAFPLDVAATGVDALYCGGAKWLMALQGVSFLYVRPELLDRLQLSLPGWRSVRDIWDFLQYEQPPFPGAERFEGGTPNFIGALSLSESIAVLRHAGAHRIAAHVLQLTDRLAEGLQRAQARIVSVRSPATSSGIVTFTLPEADALALGKALQGEGFITTYRSNGVRVAPHGYNTLAEIDDFIDAVHRYRKAAACSR